MTIDPTNNTGQTYATNSRDQVDRGRQDSSSFSNIKSFFRKVAIHIRDNKSAYVAGVAVTIAGIASIASIKSYALQTIYGGVSSKGELSHNNENLPIGNRESDATKDELISNPYANGKKVSSKGINNIDDLTNVQDNIICDPNFFIKMSREIENIIQKTVISDKQDTDCITDSKYLPISKFTSIIDDAIKKYDTSKKFGLDYELKVLDGNIVAFAFFYDRIGNCRVNSAFEISELRLHPQLAETLEADGVCKFHSKSSTLPKLSLINEALHNGHEFENPDSEELVYANEKFNKIRKNDAKDTIVVEIDKSKLKKLDTKSA